ncbi:hypothetical protein [Sphingopyxis witflariensis]|jgi:hypothetical protein|uniref:hypothetical protein n=1 Tax=Sphingopyxis witflariensis TaxID=173675 RepID=UPI0011819B73|nr:hypothetical protein [Sphingopyxis witflariensis]
MSNRTTPLWKSALVPTAAILAGLSVSACGGADTSTANTAAADNVALPIDESAARDDAGVAAEMHNQMSGQAGNQTDAAAMPMGDDQMGAGGMGNGQMGGMMDDMPMGGGNMAASKGGMGDHHMGMSGNMSGGNMNKSGTAKPAPMPKDKPMPMQDDM